MRQNRDGDESRSRKESRAPADENREPAESSREESRQRREKVERDGRVSKETPTKKREHESNDSLKLEFVRCALLYRESAMAVVVLHLGSRRGSLEQLTCVIV